MKLEIQLPDNTLAIEGGREVCDLLNQMCRVSRDWALATGSSLSIVRDRPLHTLAGKDFVSAVKET